MSKLCLILWVMACSIWGNVEHLTWLDLNWNMKSKIIYQFQLIPKGVCAFVVNSIHWFVKINCQAKKEDFIAKLCNNQLVIHASYFFINFSAFYEIHLLEIFIQPGCNWLASIQSDEIKWKWFLIALFDSCDWKWIQLTTVQWIWIQWHKGRKWRQLYICRCQVNH